LKTQPKPGEAGSAGRGGAAERADIRRSRMELSGARADEDAIAAKALALTDELLSRV